MPGERRRSLWWTAVAGLLRGVGGAGAGAAGGPLHRGKPGTGIADGGCRTAEGGDSGGAARSRRRSAARGGAPRRDAALRGGGRAGSRPAPTAPARPAAGSRRALAVGGDTSAGAGNTALQSSEGRCGEPEIAN